MQSAATVFRKLSRKTAMHLDEFSNGLSMLEQKAGPAQPVGNGHVTDVDAQMVVECCWMVLI